MSTKTENGKFVWHELMTTDLATARRFYEALLPWTISEVDMPGGQGKYHLIRLKDGGRDIGGMIEMQPSDGHPTHWIGYVTVDSADAAAERAPRLGGKVVVPPMDIPNIGRFAIIKDPQGAFTTAFQYAGHEGKDDSYPPGTFCWNEVMTTDTKKAAAFYGELYGWSAAEMDMGPMGTYTLFKQGDQNRGGAMQMPPDAPAPPHWMHYVVVEDVDATYRQAQALGAASMMPPGDIPNIGRFAVLRDPSGGLFALFKGAAQAQAK